MKITIIIFAIALSSCSKQWEDVVTQGATQPDLCRGVWYILEEYSNNSFNVKIAPDVVTHHSHSVCGEDLKQQIQYVNRVDTICGTGRFWLYRYKIAIDTCK